MSEKQTKRKRGSISLPKYDLQNLLSELTHICELSKMSGDQLISYILSDWLITFYMASDSKESSLLSFLGSHERHVEVYRKWLLEQESKSHSTVT